MKMIPLTKGKRAIIDDCDFISIVEYRWHARESFTPANGKTKFCATRTERKNGITKTIFMHRAIANAPDGLSVDHINGDTLDNTRKNLRIATIQQNCWNRIPNSGKKFKGVIVRKNRKKFSAQIKINWKSIHLGYFDTRMEAAIAYDVAAKKYFGQFARLNFPEDLTA